MALGARVRARADSSGRPFVTDEGHHVLDLSTSAKFPTRSTLARQLEEIPGAVEHGLFIGMAERGSDRQGHGRAGDAPAPIDRLRYPMVVVCSGWIL